MNFMEIKPSRMDIFIINQIENAITTFFCKVIDIFINFLVFEFSYTEASKNFQTHSSHKIQNNQNSFFL